MLCKSIGYPEITPQFGSYAGKTQAIYQWDITIKDTIKTQRLPESEPEK
jgi:hypothetical protein